MDGRLDPSVAAVRVAVRRACADLEPGASVVVACSGGADSLALADATVFEARAAGWLVSAAVVDHGLQPGSDEVAAQVAGRLDALGCPATVLAVDVGADGGGPESAARAARYRALEALAAATDAVVLLGHTLDDQAESVLLGLARGSGNRSLAGMAAVRGRFRRPLLELRRATTAAACAAVGLDVWSDPHNVDPRFLRVRVRRDVIPAVEAALGPGVVEALGRTARSARDDADALDGWADAVYAAAAGDGCLETAGLAALPGAVRRRVLHRALLAVGCPAGNVAASHLEAVDALVVGWHGQGPIDLPGGIRASRVDGVLRFDSER